VIHWQGVGGKSWMDKRFEMHGQTAMLCYEPSCMYVCVISGFDSVSQSVKPRPDEVLGFE
jgi:hypothetical protein